jgi:ATP-dependent DNA helicase DinG
MSLPESWFEAQGPLAKAAPAYRLRPGQVTLAGAIQENLESRGVLVAEAGTGVGKTFAYLVPLLHSGEKVLISTATRHLQDQLIEKDLPRVKAAFGASLQAAVLKGRSNYLCLHRMEQHEAEGRFARREEAHAFREIVRFSKVTTSGDIAECNAVSESAVVWAQVTSTRENCLGQNCPQLADCFVMSARKKAAEADLVVVNHHLLCADMALREEGFGELLPTVAHVVIDEAHALPEIAVQFFGHSLSTQTVNVFTRDVLAAGLSHARDAASWPDLSGAIDKSTADLRLLMSGSAGQRISWDQIGQEQQQRWQEKLEALRLSLQGMNEVLEINAERHIELEQLHSRCQDLLRRLSHFCSQQEGALVVRWVEATKYAITLHVTPYDIREKFSQEMAKHQRSWSFVSATLAVGGSFAHFNERLGLDDAQTLIAESPFHFQQQGLLYVPQNSPDPKSPQLMAQLLEQPEVSELIDECEGGVFLLCTSHRAVGLAKDWLSRWAVRHPDRLILVQGDAPRGALIEQFRGHGRAVLAGSHSFWEGVDVPGVALSMVVIDKLPFAPPDDPVLAARSRWLERQGRDPFMTIQVPEAALLLKQGVGRLIRSETDRGVVVIGDRRLAETAYGRRILRSLPDFKRTRNYEEVRAWATRT